MVFKRIKSALFGVFKRGHPDIYNAFKHYCEEKGVNMSDITASAIASWMASDAEGKAELEQAMKERRVGAGGSSTNIKGTLAMFKDMCESMGVMFKTMNEARAGMSISAMLSDFKAVSSTISEMKSTASEAGKGSAEDLLLTALLAKIIPGGFGGAKRKTGTGKIKEVD